MNERKRPGQSDPPGRAELRAKHRSNLPPELKRRIGESLRLMYADVLKENVPDRFIALLKRLDEASEQSQ
jgi:hypothetical protein